MTTVGTGGQLAWVYQGEVWTTGAAGTVNTHTKVAARTSAALQLN